MKNSHVISIENNLKYILKHSASHLNLLNYSVTITKQLQYTNYLIIFKGAGGPDLGILKIEFSIVHDRGESELPDNFYRIKKY